MRKDVFFVVSTTVDGSWLARAIGHPVEARGATPRELRRAAQAALAAHLGPVGWSRRVTLVRTRQALAA